MTRPTIGLFAALPVLIAQPAAVQDGWGVPDLMRKLGDRKGLVWEADFQQGADGFALEKCDGAEGEIGFVQGKMVVRKTNYRGYLRINSVQTFSKPVGFTLKSFADAEVTGADPNYSLAFPRIVDGRNALTPCVELDGKGVFMWGGEKNAYLANTPPGVVERRFSNFKVEVPGGTDLRPVLVIGGAPSETLWHRWGVQNYAFASAEWKKMCVRYQSGLAGKTNLEDRTEFDRRLASDTDHTAKVVKRGGRVRLVVDGKDEVPVFFKNPGSWDENWGDCNGRDMAKAGVRLQCFDVGKVKNWTNGCFDVEREIRNVRDRMRASPDALTVLSVYLSMPKEYAERHPTELWRQPDGTPCVGQEFHMYSPHYNSPSKTPYRPKNPGCVWPWISCASKVYERDVKDNLTQLLEGLRRESLDKRIVGFHIAGWHDGQFSMYRSDYSPPAKEGFRDYLVEKYGSAPEHLDIPVPDRKPYYDPASERLSYDWNVYQHLLPFRFQERIARHLKKVIAKDVVCLHWCMDVYADIMGGSFYFDEFLASDAMDGLVSQSSYVRRLPGNSVGCAIPYASFNRAGKLYVDELDLRAWGCVPGYVKEESMGGLGFAMDLPEWQSVNRKMAGRLIAHDQGYWYYDISGGFWNPDEIERDIGESIRTYAAQRQVPKVDWKPSAALVVDSHGFLWCNHVGAGRNPCGRGVVEGQVGLLAASGVPYDAFTYADAARGDGALAPYKVVVMAGFREMDDVRRSFLSGLVKAGKTVVLLAGSGGFRGLERPVGRSPEILAVDPARQSEFMSRFYTSWLRWSLGSTVGDLAQEMRPMSYSFEEREGTAVLARYADDGRPAVIRRGSVVVVGQNEGLSPRFFNRLVREAGGYVPVEKGLQIDMNGEFMSLCALENGDFEVRLPPGCRVRNLKTGLMSAVSGSVLHVKMIVGEVRWYRLEWETQGDTPRQVPEK